ncbi:hypothetical protein BCD48_38070 [Pseudofrankia sp. BMG5.36]|nr:hypothetical protein BCD48_38070 [Pseudofrankia sp. BMG5.36]
MVQELFAKMPLKGGFIDAIDELFADDAVFAPGPGFPNQSGKQAILALVRSHLDALKYTNEIEVVNVASNGTKVLTERIDWFLDEAGERIHKMELMGVFEVVDGKIRYWRDYFDPRQVEDFGADLSA